MYCTVVVRESNCSTAILKALVDTFLCFQVPKKRFRMGMLPTPIHPWPLPRVPEGVDVWIKRDDLTGCQLSGNKVSEPLLIVTDADKRAENAILAQKSNVDAGQEA